ncbi:MAG: ABC transporter ATP-binding protein [Geodermatophilaceae bacterium]
MAIAAVREVTMRFRGHTALHNVSATFEENVITGLLGRNGAGKTTMMQLLAGHLVPTSGNIEVFGGNPYENESVLQRMSLVKENQKYPEYFRVADAMSAAAMLFPNWDAGYAKSLVADFDLPQKRRIKKLSRGMLSAVGIVIGLASRAPLTFFDEPYLGLDAVARQMFYDRLIADYAENPSR